MKRTAIVSLVSVSLSLALVGALASCKRDQAAADNAAGGKNGRGMRMGDGGVAFAVDALEVKPQKVDYVVTAPGTIEAFERVQVTSRVAGVVDRVAFSEGQDVKAGDMLVAIDSERFKLAVNSS